MRHALLLAALVGFAPVSKAETRSPEDTVEWLVNGMHCVPDSKEFTDTWAQVRFDPQTYLPLLKARVSLEAIEAAQHPNQLMPIQSAVSVLTRLGVSEGREFLVKRLSQFQRRREELAEQVKARTPGPGTTFAPGEEAPFRALLWQRTRIERVEVGIVSGFTEAGDPRLRDNLLRRLDHEQDRAHFALYVDYFAATAKEDPEVRARLKTLRESADFLTKDALQRFFAWW